MGMGISLKPLDKEVYILALVVNTVTLILYGYLYINILSYYIGTY